MSVVQLSVVKNRVMVVVLLFRRTNLMLVVKFGSWLMVASIPCGMCALIDAPQKFRLGSGVLQLSALPPRRATLTLRQLVQLLELPVMQVPLAVLLPAEDLGFPPWFALSNCCVVNVTDYRGDEDRM